MKQSLYLNLLAHIYLLITTHLVQQQQQKVKLKITINHYVSTVMSMKAKKLGHCIKVNGFGKIVFVCFFILPYYLF